MTAKTFKPSGAMIALLRHFSDGTEKFVGRRTTQSRTAYALARRGLVDIISRQAGTFRINDAGRAALAAHDTQVQANIDAANDVLAAVKFDEDEPVKTGKVTERQAQAVLAAVKHQFRSYTEPLVIDGKDWGAACPDPILIMDYDGVPAIAWEDGPDEWAYRVNEGGTSEEERVLMQQAAHEFGAEYREPAGVQPAKLPTGVYVEPIYSFVLGIYLDGTTEA